ncbi:MAG TPA: hypothetical protein DDW21_06205 [Verrucomicrobiales bacterium]|nr:hypothetical protein [Verrucomicrobiales bacterium]
MCRFVEARSNEPHKNMSIHATLSTQAQERLEAQKRNSTLVSIILSLLTVALIALLLAFYLLPQIVKTTDVIVMIHPAPIEVEPTPTPKKFNRSVTKPCSSSSSARVYKAMTSAQTAIPVPDVDFTFPSLDFGHGNDFAEGWEAGDGKFGGSGNFGSTNRSSGGLEGTMYDFKKKRNGEDVPYEIANPYEFVERAVRLQKSDFSDSSLSRYFRAPQSLFLIHLAIPFSNAENGPSFFGAEKEIKPSGWFVHYQGRISVPRSGTYRFSGLGDDYLVLILKGRVRLAACWSDIQPAIAERWESTKPTGEWLGPFGNMRLVYGDWVHLREGEVIDIDLAIGERPGGKVGFILHVEEKGVDYRKDSQGRPILPLFATAPISNEEKQRITSDFGNYEIEWEKVPVFSMK